MTTSDSALLAQEVGTVVSETIGGESIIVNLHDGRYHRVTGTASAIWVALATPTSWEQLLAVVSSSAPDMSPSLIARFVCDLMASSLAVVQGARREDFDRLAAAAPPRAPGDPVIESYDDMADLLLLDPVHEVGEQGWPVKPDQAT